MTIKLNNKIIILLLLFILLFSEGIIGTIILPVIVIVGLFLVLINPKKMLGYLCFAYKKSLAVKLLILFVISVVLGFMFNFILGKASILRFIIGGVGGYLLHFIFPFFIGMLIVNKFNENTIIKLFITALSIILIAGIIEFILYKNGLHWFNFINLLCSGRESVSNYKWSVAPRIQSFFAEPSHYAWFLVCNIPIAFEIYKSKFCLYRNKWINKILSKMILPIVILSIILTQSSINLIFAVILSSVYLLSTSKISFKQILRCTLVIIFVIALVSIILLNININDTYLSRVINAVPALFNLDTLVIVEPSLATRIISYINYTIIFFKHPLFGVSCGHLIQIFVTQLQHSPTVLTPELIGLMYKPKVLGINPSILFKVLAETGIVGISLFLLFLLRIEQYAKSLYKVNYGFKGNWYRGIFYTILFFIFLTIYDSSLYNHYFWILFGAVCGMHLKIKSRNIIQDNSKKEWKSSGRINNICKL